jgi:hypothetical protein
MNSNFAPAITLATFAIGFCLQAAAQQSNSASTSVESPFACNRLALSPGQRKRHFDELGPALRTLKTDMRELTDGFEFKFPSDTKTYQSVAEWVAGERVCCPFFDIDLRSEREGGALWLRLTGREGTKQFIEADFGKWFKP